MDDSNEKSQKQTEDWGSDEGGRLDIKAQDVSEKDKFKLATRILLVAAIAYMLIAICYIVSFPGKMVDVWDYSKVFLNSLISIILGYYFGKK